MRSNRHIIENEFRVNGNRGYMNNAPPIQTSLSQCIGHELVRLAIPRRVYTQSHIDYCVEVIQEVYRYRDGLKGLEIKYEAEYLRHFTAKLKTIE
jgi:tryptophanase